MCHLNAVSVAHSLKNPSSKRIVQVAARATLFELLVYTVIGLFGFLTFGHEVPGDFMLLYPASDPLMMGCRGLYAVVALVSVVLNVNPTVNALEAVLFVSPNTDFRRRAGLLFCTLALCGGAGLAVNDLATIVACMGGFFGTLFMLLGPTAVYVGSGLYATHRSPFREGTVGLLSAASLAALAALFV